MKCVLHSWMIVVLAVAMISPAVAQSGHSDIGSYQSILARAGYRSASPIGGGHAVENDIPLQPPSNNSMPVYSEPEVNYNAGMPVTAPPSIPHQYNGGTNQFNGGPSQGYISNSTDCGNRVYTPGSNCGACGACGSQAYGPGCSDGSCVGAAVASRDTNTVVGMFGLAFTRDYEDDLRMGGIPGTSCFYSTDADHGTMGGVGLDVFRRNCSGTGFGVRYWGIYADQAVASISWGTLQTCLTGLGGATYGAYTVEQIYDYGTSYTLSRDSEMHNVEINMLRNGGCFKTRRCKSANFELFGGFRLFEFDENLRFATYQTGAPAGVPTDMYYNLDTSNTLLGTQVGGRTEVCFSNRLRFSGSSRVGIFNNRINAAQAIRVPGGPYATNTNAGGDFNYYSQKDDIAFLGEFDASFIYQVNRCIRLNIGYRAVGVAGVALAANQYISDFGDVSQINRIKSNGQLLMHGGYGGIEFSY